MDAAYVFRVTVRLDAPSVGVDPDSFETVVTKPAAEPGTEGWLFFRDALWRGEVSDAAYLRELAEEWLSVPVAAVSFSELRTDEAYLAATPGEKYLLYFPCGGSVRLDLRDHPARFAVRWVEVSTGEWGPRDECEGGRRARLGVPGPGGWVAVLTRQRSQ